MAISALLERRTTQDAAQDKRFPLIVAGPASSRLKWETVMLLEKAQSARYLHDATLVFRDDSTSVGTKKAIYFWKSWLPAQKPPSLSLPRACRPRESRFRGLVPCVSDCSACAAALRVGFAAPQLLSLG